MENKNNNKIISEIQKWLNNERVSVISRYCKFKMDLLKRIRAIMI